MLRAIIVDDEELSIKRLKNLLAESDDIEISGTFQSPAEAYEFVKENQVHIAFLDISMPEINGMKLSGMLHELDEDLDVVFVTSYDEYAVQAFDMSALDYLLKPVTAQRLAKSLDKFRKKHRIMVSAPSLSVRFFQGLKIKRRDVEKDLIKLRSPKTEELFAFLVCKRTVSREEVIDTFWSGLDPERAGNNLNTSLYYIRKALSASNVENSMIAGKTEIRIDEGVVSSDLYKFQQVVKEFRLAPERCKELAERAKALYTGEFLRGKAYEWASELSRQLEREYIEILEGAARLYLKQKQQHKSLHYFTAILELDPMREDINHEVILLFMEMGRKNEAIRQYRRLEELLQKELGTTPDPTLKSIVASLMHS